MGCWAAISPRLLHLASFCSSLTLTAGTALLHFGPPPPPQVENIIEMPQNDGLALLEASRICNQDIVGRVQQVICFAFHDSNLLLETCQLARAESKPVCLFYLD